MRLKRKIKENLIFFTIILLSIGFIACSSDKGTKKNVLEKFNAIINAEKRKEKYFEM